MALDLDAAIDGVGAPQDKPPATDPIDSAIDRATVDDGSLAKQRLRASMSAAVQVNPDQAAEAKRLSVQTGIPAPVAERNLEAVRQKAAVPQFDSLLECSRTFGSRRQDPQFNKVAHDDVDRLAVIEDYVKRLGASAANTPAELVKGFGGAFNKLGELGNYVIAGLGRLLLAQHAPGVEPDAVLEPIYRSITAQKANEEAFAPGGGLAGHGGEPMAPEQVANALGDAAGQLVQAILTGGESAAPEAGTSTLEAVRASLEHGIKAMAAPATTSAVERGRATFEASGDPVAAVRAALAQYEGSTLQGVIPLTAPGSLPARLAMGALTGPAGAEVSKELVNSQLPPNLREPTTANDVLISAITGMVLATGGPRAQAARQSGEALRGITEAAKASKLATRDPGALQALVREASADGEVFVDARQFASVLNQSGITAEQLAAAAPEAAKNLPAALATGGDVRIPLDEYVAKIAPSKAGDALLPHVKTTPDGLTVQEAEDFQKADAGKLKEHAEKVLAARRADNEFQTSAKAVEKALFDQLQQAGRFTEDVHKGYAAMLGANYASLARRLGITPQEAYQRFPLQIVSEPVAGEGATVMGQPPAPAWPHVADALERSADDVPTLREQVKTLVDDGRAPQDLADAADGAPDGDFLAAVKAAAAEVKRGGTGSRISPDDVLNHTFGLKLAQSPRQGELTADDVQRFADSLKQAADLGEFDLRLLPGGEIRLETMASKRTGEGAGSRAMKALTEFADQHGKRLVLNLAEKNFQPMEGGPRTTSSERLRQFYKRFGFVENKGKRKDFALSDAMYRDPQKIMFQPPPAEGSSRGAIAFGQDISKQPSILTLMKSADLSTFLHETGHFNLEVLAHVASLPEAPEGIRADMHTLLQWFGVKDLAAWRALSAEQKRPYHEQFARGFEAYLMEGKAPNVELAGIFARFRAWLLSIYQSVKALGVDVSPEVRGVMDRMLASEEQIHEAEAARAYAPLFKSATAAGMTAEEWGRYQALGAQATRDAVAALEQRSLRDMRWLDNARGRALRALQKEAAEKRKAVRREVQAEVQAQPVYAARRFLTRGELPEARGRSGSQRDTITEAGLKGTKLSLPVLKEMYGEAPNAIWRHLKTGKYGYAAEQGLDPDLVAELFGFTSGDHLVREILAAKPESEAVNELTDQRVLERYGDLNSPQAIARAVDQAVHNEARARLLATELNAMQKAMGQRKVLASAARQFAEQIVARQKIAEVRPAQYASAEARAARNAERAKALPEKAMEKRNQLINFYAARAADNALEEVDKGLRYLRKFDSDSVRKRLDPDYADQIDAMLERFDLRRGTSAKDVARRQQLADWIEAQRKAGIEPAIDEALKNEAFRKPYREMTVEEFRGLIDAVRNIEHLGDLKHRLLTAQDARTFREHADEAVASIEENAKRRRPEKLESNTNVDRAVAGVDDFFASHRKLASLVREMDGVKDGGAMWDLFVRPLNEASDREVTMRADATKAFADMLEPLSHLKQKQYIPEIDASLSREGRLAVLLNWGNEANRQRVMGGDGWNQAQVEAIIRTLAPHELEFANKVWEYLDSYWPAIAAKERRVSGITPEKVEATPFEAVANDGSTVKMRGGYYPIKYDPARSTRAEADDLAEVIKQSMQGLYTRATTRRGHTQTRVEEVSGRPVRKDLGVVDQHLTQVIHDLALHEYLIDANRLLRDKAMDRAIRDHYGPAVLRQMRGLLDDVAAGDIPAQNSFEKAVNWLRTGSSIATMAWNLTTAIMQPLGLTQSMVRIGPKWVGKGMARWLRGAANMENTAQWIYDKSPMMANRGRTMQREINEISNKVRGKNTVVDGTFFYLIHKLQLVADIPTWLGAYEKAMAEGGDGMDAAKLEKRAIALADQAVLDAQGGGQVKDLAAIQRGGPLLKLFTNFYSFFNTTYNLTAESIARTKFKDPASVGRLAVDMMLLYTVPAALSTMLHAALKPGDEKDLKHQLIADQLTYLLGTMVGIREMSSAVQGALHLKGSDYTGPAGLRFFAAVSQLTKQAQQGEIDKALWHALNQTGGILFHYPAAQVQRTVDGLVAMAKGQTKNPVAIVAGPPAK